MVMKWTMKDGPKGDVVDDHAGMRSGDETVVIGRKELLNATDAGDGKKRERTKWCDFGDDRTCDALRKKEAARHVKTGGFDGIPFRFSLVQANPVTRF